MGTRGKHWARRNIKWTPEIQQWLRERVPLREHGYTCRKEVLAELNAAFGTDFTLRAFATHCNESRILTGLAASGSGIPRGERHWRHRPVGSLQEKKGYLRIKVAEPNVWMQYQRYVWEQAHPGESAEGMTVIFMDGDNRNFDPANLERVTRGELSVMAELGHTASMTREEREIYLLRARLAIAKGALIGRKDASRMSRKAYYERVKDDPEFKAKRAAYARRKLAEIMADPARHEELLRKQREYRKRNRDRVNAGTREHRGRRRNAEGR